MGNRSREAWLAVLAAALGVSPVACQGVATPTVVAAREVTTGAPTTSDAQGPDSAPSAVDAAAAPMSTQGAAPLEATAPSTLPVLTALPAAPPGAPPSTPMTALSTIRGAPGIGNASCGASNRQPALRAQIAVSSNATLPGDTRALQSLVHGLKGCGDQGLRSDPRSTGAIVVRVSIGAAGDVVEAAASGGLSGNVARCMSARFRAAAFARIALDAGATRSIVVRVVVTTES